MDYLERGSRLSDDRCHFDLNEVRVGGFYIINLVCKRVAGHL